jgi:hypothetical protein
MSRPHTASDLEADLTRPELGGTSKSTHGGARAGAGRHKTVAKGIRRTVYLDQRHVDLIAREPGKTFSEALRNLLDRSKRDQIVKAGHPRD